MNIFRKLKLAFTTEKTIVHSSNYEGSDRRRHHDFFVGPDRRRGNRSNSHLFPK